jgi:hypothetical protein
MPDTRHYIHVLMMSTDVTHDNNETVVASCRRGLECFIGDMRHVDSLLQKGILIIFRREDSC